MPKKYYYKDEIINRLYHNLTNKKKVEVLEAALINASMYPKSEHEVIIEAMGFELDGTVRNREAVYRKAQST